ncbi:MAG: hypothetical protein B6I37_08010 [Desulfobacteraceae bacterium 4572_35.2]|nr:MAG: hypothetical protein B6I37_08010 [Desulfobacteraceae bacterium 4572_35.2]
MKTGVFQSELRPLLPVVFGAKDYREFRTTIDEMDRILTTTGIEHRMLVQHLTSSQYYRSDGYRQRQNKTFAWFCATPFCWRLQGFPIGSFRTALPVVP